MKKVSIEVEKNIEYSTNKGKNVIKKMIENSFLNLEMDKNNYGKDKWNPLGDNLIREGDTVLIKPNLVLDKNQNGLGEECLYTNVSIAEAILPYVLKALNGKGKIIIADAPVQSCDFENLVDKSGYKSLVDSYKEKNIDIELKDLRRISIKTKTRNHQTRN